MRVFTFLLKSSFFSDFDTLVKMLKKKLLLLKKNGDISWNENQKCLEPQTCRWEKRTLPLERAIPIIIAPFGFAIADGRPSCASKSFCLGPVDPGQSDLVIHEMSAKSSLGAGGA